MRGKAADEVAVCPQPGITPAHAGKSNCAFVWCICVKDHPRACGEKQNAPLQKQNQRGSPPRMRGKATLCMTAIILIRITPAHAGKSLQKLFIVLWPRDHPRACGEKYSVLFGKVMLKRITPAHAGKRLKRSRITDCFRCVPLHFRLVSHKLSASNGSRAPPGALPCLPAQNAAPVQAVYNWTGPVFFAVQE